MEQVLTPAAQSTRLMAVRRQFFELGQTPETGLRAPVLRSWQRCRGRGLDDRAAAQAGLLDRSLLGEARERSRRLLGQASGVMEHLFEHIRSSGSMVLLADSDGLILHGLGDADFVDRASRVALQPGASWSERDRGTNAIGAALIEGGPNEILGGEHYLQRNAGLSCSAAPIFDSGGALLGVLDISSDWRRHQSHTLGLARLGARMLERRLFEAEHTRHLLLAFHTRPEGVGGLQDGLLAVSADGEILAADGVARRLLGVEARGGGALGDFDGLFRTPFGVAIDRAARDPVALLALDLRCGGEVYARARVGLSWRAQPGASAPSARSAPAARKRAATGRRGLGGADEAKAEAMPLPTEAVTLVDLATGDAALQRALDHAGRIAGRNIPLLIQGESGVGKEVFARAFHNSGPRAGGPFVALNCAAIPETLIESELFGYVGGAFTGARREGAAGKIQQAHGGTLFLDEIGDMPLSMQARLLRVLQDRCVQPVGGSSSVAVDISLVCATHRVLADAVRAGGFREDLYYRVNGLTVSLPPLRARSDIRRIVRRLVAAEIEDGASGRIKVSEEVMRLFERRPWPGNIRQLQNVLRVAVALLDEGEREICPRHLPEAMFAAELAPGEQTSPLRQPAARAAAAPGMLSARGMRLKEAQLDVIERVMEEVGGNLTAAARQLGISRNTLYRRLGRMR